MACIRSDTFRRDIQGQRAPDGLAFLLSGWLKYSAAWQIAAFFTLFFRKVLE